MINLPSNGLLGSLIILNRIDLSPHPPFEEEGMYKFIALDSVIK
jgi:hypothetical protein